MLLEWADSFYETIKFVFLVIKKSKPISLDDLNEKAIQNLIKCFPKDLIKTPRDLKFVMSKIAYYLGRLDVRFQNEPGGQALDYSFWAHNDHIVMLSNLFVRILESIEYPHPDYKECVGSLLYDPNPLFYREDADALSEMDIDPAFENMLPPAFYENPTQFIENLPFIERLDMKKQNDSYGNICSLLTASYDYTRVRRYKNLVFKRVDLTKVRFGTEEILQAEKIKQKICAINDSRIQVQSFVGFVYDQGNVYLISERVSNSINFNTLKHKSLSKQQEKIYDQAFGKIKDAIEGHHPDLSPRNVLVQYKNKRMKPGEEKTFVVIDFEKYT